MWSDADNRNKQELQDIEKSLKQEKDKILGNDLPMQHHQTESDDRKPWSEHVPNSPITDSHDNSA